MGEYILNKNYIVYCIEDKKRFLIYNKNNESAYSLGEVEFKMLQHIVKSKSILEAFYSQHLYPIDEFLELEKKYKNVGLIEETNNNEKKGKIMHCYDWNKIICCNKFTYFTLCIILASAIPLMLTGIILDMNNISRLIESNLNITFQNVIVSIVLLGFSFLCGLFFHEISHALVATWMGAFVPEIAFGRKRILLHAYAKIIGISNLENINKKIVIYLAGPLINVFLLGFGLHLQYYTNEMYYITWSMIIPNFFLAVFNISIFNYADGAETLSELAFTPKYSDKFIKADKVV